MQRDELRVLIVDDDKTLGAALAQAISKSGYKSIHVTSPDEALTTLNLHPVHAVVIDCMLPKMNGRDLAKKIKQDFSDSMPILMMSGIFKDKNFVRETQQATGAVNFLTKPFDLADFMKEIDGILAPLADAPISPLTTLLTKTDASHKERIKAVNDTQEVHGFDLPWIYSLLLHPRIKGHLTIVTADGAMAGVGLDNGSIMHVDSDDAQSYFGVLMVEYGFITQEELDEVASKAGSKRLGERLVEANVISPHAIQIVMAEQQGIRLSQTISNTSVKVNFVESEEIRQNATTDRVAFTDLLNEWLLSKFTIDWLKSFYMPWLKYNLKKGPEYSPHHRLFRTPVVQRVPDLLHALLENANLESALATRSEPEDHLYRALHSLVVSRVVRFGDAISNADFTSKGVRLTKLLNTLDSQTHFQRLGVSAKAKDVEIKRAYHELAKVLHPDRLPAEAPEELRHLAQAAFDKVAKAYQVLSDPDEKANYLLEMEKGQTESVLKAESMIEQARELLSKGDISKARSIVEEAIKLAPPTSEAKLVRMWARLKKPHLTKDSSSVKEIREQLASIPPEDRHGATFYFVKGLLYKISGDLANAKKNFEHAVSVHADFIDARRELHNLSANQPKNPDILRGDLKDVVGMLFKKKK